VSDGLARLLLLTDRRACRRSLLDVLARCVDAGARSVVLREKDLPAGERARLADGVAALLDPVGGLLVLAGAAAGAARPAAVHLAAGDAVPDPRPALLGRSCHDAAEVARAAGEGCDWVTVSPVWETASKPGYGPALGLAGLAGLAAGAPPAYALGGVTPERARRCRDAGAHGVAVMGAVMGAERPGEVVAALLAALDGACAGNRAAVRALESSDRSTTAP